jgi:hypothetical protein
MQFFLMLEQTALKQQLHIKGLEIIRVLYFSAASAIRRLLI